MKIYVEGKLKKRSWQDRDGNTRYSTEIVVDEMTILSSKNERGDQAQNDGSYSNEGTPPPPSPLTGLDNSIDDVLPF